MTARYEVHPSLRATVATHPTGAWPAFWHKRSANGEITAVSETFTRHEDAVRGIRADLETTAQILCMNARTYEDLVAPEVTYFDVTGYDGDGLPIYTEKPLYPVRVVPEASS